MRCKINTNILKYILYRYIIKKNWKGVDRMASTIQVRVDEDIKTKARGVESNLESENLIFTSLRFRMIIKIKICK